MGFLSKVPWGAVGGAAAAPFTGGASLIPSLIGAGVGAAGSIIAGKKATASATARSPEEAAALTGAQGSATALEKGGQSLLKSGQATVNQGLNTLQQPTDYWSRLLGGNRASMAQATAAPRGAITDTYSGAERGLERSGVRGAARDVAKANLNRDQAGKIAGLTTGVQPGAAAALGDIGAKVSDIGVSTSSTGANLAGQSGGIFSNLLGQGQQNRVYGRAQGQQTGSSLGGFLFDMLSGSLGKQKPKVPLLPSTNYGNGMSTPPTIY